MKAARQLMPFISAAATMPAEATPTEPETPNTPSAMPRLTALRSQAMPTGCRMAANTPSPPRAKARVSGSLVRPQTMVAAPEPTKNTTIIPGVDQRSPR